MARTADNPSSQPSAHPGSRAQAPKAEAEGTESSASGPRLPPLAHARRILALIVVTTVVMSMSGSMLNIAVPGVSRHFAASPTATSWIVLSAMVSQTCLTITFGRLSDMVGKRAMFLSGLALFTLSALLLGFSPNVGVLIALRAAQAAGVAMLLCNNAALIASTFPAHRVGPSMGIYMSSFSIAQLAGPAVGGMVQSALGWRWVFWINVPLGAAAMAWAVFSLPPLPAGDRSRRSLDVAGNLLVFASLILLLVGLSDVQQRPVRAITEMVIGLVLLGILVLVESRVSQPIVAIDLFRRRSFTWANLTAFLMVMPRFAVVIAIGLYFQAVDGDSAFVAGVKVMPLAVGVFAGSLLASRCSQWLGIYVTAAAGSAVMGLSVAMFLLLMGPGASYGAVIAPLLVMGLGAGVALPSNSLVIIR